MAHDFACKVQCVTPWFRLMRKRGCEQMRLAPVLRQKDAQMVLRGDMEHYLSLGCDHGRLED